MFKLSNAFLMSYRSLKSSKLRTGLTAIGIIIGIASVVSIAAVGTSFQTYFESQVIDSGSNYIQVFANDDHVLRKNELDIVRNTRGVIAASPVCVTTAHVTFMNESKTVMIMGVDENFEDIINVNMLEGDFIRRTDNGSAVIYSDIADNLFENEISLRNVISIDLYNRLSKTESRYNFKVKGIQGIEEEDKSIVSGVMGLNAIFIPLDM